MMNSRVSSSCSLCIKVKYVKFYLIYFRKNPDTSQAQKNESIQKCVKKRKFSELDENDENEVKEHQLIIEHDKTSDINVSNLIS